MLAVKASCAVSEDPAHTLSRAPEVSIDDAQVERL